MLINVNRFFTASITIDFSCFIFDSFAIDLKQSGSRTIALHLNPRMKEKVFVRNSYLYDSWGDEERQLQEFPFFPDLYFEVSENYIHWGIRTFFLYCGVLTIEWSLMIL